MNMNMNMCSLSGGARHCTEQDPEHMVMVVGGDSSPQTSSEF